MYLFKYLINSTKIKGREENHVNQILQDVD
jgi:hypothetical protein